MNRIVLQHSSTYKNVSGSKGSDKAYKFRSIYRRHQRYYGTHPKMKKHAEGTVSLFWPDILVTRERVLYLAGDVALLR